MRKSYDRLSRRQLGLVTSSQMARLGWTHHAVLHLVSKGLLFPVRRQVWRTAGSPESQEMMLLAAVLAAGYDPGDSDPEVDLVDTLVAAGFPRPAQQVRVELEGRKMFIDVGWPELRVGYEYDSLEYHEHRFHEDRDRLRRLKRAGWDVWPITSTTSRNEILAIATGAFAQLRAA